MLIPIPVACPWEMFSVKTWFSRTLSVNHPQQKTSPIQAASQCLLLEYLYIYTIYVFYISIYIYFIFMYSYQHIYTYHNSSSIC